MSDGDKTLRRFGFERSLPGLGYSPVTQNLAPAAPRFSGAFLCGYEKAVLVRRDQSDPLVVRPYLDRMAVHHWRASIKTASSSSQRKMRGGPITRPSLLI